MKNFVAILFLNLFAVLSIGQVTIIVDKVPESTANLDQVYIAGTFNNWTPNVTPLAKMADGRFKIKLPISGKKVKFKFTRGDWEKVECRVDGSFQPDRIIKAEDGAEVHFEIEAWNDLHGTSKKSTANEQVTIMRDSFYIPQLKQYRRVWTYLPSDYETSDETYPVLYLHDGQNVFDASTSYNGEWKVDETLTRLEKEKNLKLIVIAIDNGESMRTDEYTPWKHPKHGGGNGSIYINFIVNTLKMHVDAHYRTKPQREFTGIMGSSLGGLISMYGMIEHQNVFGRAGVFSPSFWFSKQAYEQVETKGNQFEDTKIYMIMGKKEGKSMVKGIKKMTKTLKKTGFNANQYQSIIHEDGTHSEWYWEREFEAAVLWLFN